MAQTRFDSQEDRERQAWLKGTLSQWVVAALIAIVGWGAKQGFDDFRNTMSKAIEQIARHEVRISVIENATGIRASKTEFKEQHLGKN